MKHHWKLLACLALALQALPCALAQGKLILPKSLDDISQLTKDNVVSCVKCGIVTNVRPEERQPTARPKPAQAPASGVGSNIVATPIIGTGSAVKDAREAMKPTTYYKITVRYEDGTYGFFEQDDQPAFDKGDRVETNEGRLELRPE